MSVIKGTFTFLTQERVCLTSAKCRSFIWAPTGQVFVFHFMPFFLIFSKQEKEIGLLRRPVRLHSLLSRNLWFTNPGCFIGLQVCKDFITANDFVFITLPWRKEFSSILSAHAQFWALELHVKKQKEWTFYSSSDCANICSIGKWIIQIAVLGLCVLSLKTMEYDYRYQTSWRYWFIL